MMAQTTMGTRMTRNKVMRFGILKLRPAVAYAPPPILPFVSICLIAMSGKSLLGPYAPRRDYIVPPALAHPAISP
jgi:hypothetical protein